ncbi:MAG: methyltransferase regulatory domain-containing protein [Caulobacteraceae bacterium]|nr:methyltransferase regulatory domain-containing protein [Caulobacteraceae bacterium]
MGRGNRAAPTAHRVRQVCLGSRNARQHQGTTGDAICRRPRQRWVGVFQSEPHRGGTTAGRCRKRYYLSRARISWRHWRLSSFYEVATRMQSAGLEFVGSALLLEHGDRFTLDERGRAVIANIHHPRMCSSSNLSCCRSRSVEPRSCASSSC